MNKTKNYHCHAIFIVASLDEVSLLRLNSISLVVDKKHPTSVSFIKRTVPAQEEIGKEKLSMKNWKRDECTLMTSSFARKQRERERLKSFFKKKRINYDVHCVMAYLFL